jgi:hypothetical protein
MRWRTGVGLLALVGCNQVFGLAATREFDASIDTAADIPHVVLDYQLATQYGATGAADPMIRFAPIDPAPRVRIATLEGSFDTDQATYSPSDGWIAIPRSYLGIAWRLEYTLGDGIAREVQWAPDDKRGHLTVPLFGRVARAAVPQGGGYLLSPQGAPSLTLPRVFTTGLWTEGTVPNPSGGGVDYDFSSARPLSGGKGQLDGDAGDRALLVDYRIDAATTCRVATGAAVVSSPTLKAPHEPSSPAWDASLGPVVSAPVELKLLDRLTDGLGNLKGQFAFGRSFQALGAIPSASMPGLAATPEAASQVLALLPVPVMLTLMQCPFAQTMPPRHAEHPYLAASFVRALHVQLVDTRTALGATLASGMETVVLAGDAGGFKIEFPAPMPAQVITTMPLTVTPITLATPARGTIDLSGFVDQIEVGPRTGAFTLAFTPEPGTGLRADYFEVRLHKIVGGVLTTQRIYTITAPSLRVDPAVLEASVDYVFEIRSIKGHPNAPRGDFASIDFPYGATIVFTRTFRAS